MKRCLFGAVLLVVLLAGSLLVTWVMARWHEPMAKDLSRAADYALVSDWNNAQALAQSVLADWEQIQPFSACFADHGPMEEIGDVFAQMEVYGDAREEVAFAAACRELAEKLQAMSDAHGLQWRNLL